jgi:hypothetical protein
MQVRIGVLRRLCGLAPLAACVKPDISSSNMEFLKLEQERLAVEKVGGAAGRQAGRQGQAKGPALGS